MNSISSVFRPDSVLAAVLVCNGKRSTGIRPVRPATTATQPAESLITAKVRIRMGPVPGWVESCPFRMDFKAKQDGHVTYLLFDRQIHAEFQQTYIHVALRLDT